MANLYIAPVEREGKDSTSCAGCVIALAQNSNDARDQIMSRYRNFPSTYKNFKIGGEPHLATGSTYLISHPPGTSATPGYEQLNWSK